MLEPGSDCGHILIQMSGPVSLRLVALLAFDTVVGEGEGFLVVPAAIHYS